MLVSQQLDGYIIDKPKNSIRLLQEFEPMALQLNLDGYYLCYSGGKDSDTILNIALQSQVKFSAHYNITGIDPTEAVVHIKQVRKRLSESGINLYMETPDIFTTGIYKGLRKNMWRLIVHKMMPPTRICRYCCDQLKEKGGKDRLCLTGVRWAESTARKNRRPLEVVTSQIKNKRLFNDNDDGRRQFENCMQKGKRVINPVIEWEDEDVWEFLKSNNAQYCKLYNQGFDRIGCVGCPTGGQKGQEEDFARYPHVKQLYIKAFDKMLEYRQSRGFELKSWKTGQDVFDWWLYSQDKEQKKQCDEQLEIFEWAGINEED